MTSAITTTKTFPEGVTDSTSTITVPWTTKPTISNWYGTVALIQHTIDQCIITHCAPFTWLASPVPTSATSRIWISTNIYAVFALSANLAALQRHNQLLLRDLACSSKHLTVTLRATTALSKDSKMHNNPRPTPTDIQHMKAIRDSHARMLPNLQLAAMRAVDMVGVIGKVKTALEGIQELR